MKIFALTILLFTLAFSNCEPVEYGDKRQSQRNETPAADKKPSAKGLTARVVGISDGDSIVVLLEGKVRKRVRLATIDAPENHQAFGRPSKQSLSDLIYNKDIRVVEVDQDQYGRIVGEVFVDDNNVNLEQLRRGFAWHYKAHARQQSKEQRERYTLAENEARTKKLGLWNDTNPTPPWVYRKKNPRN